MMSVEISTNVAAAFDILLEAVEEEIGLINRVVATAAEQSDYGRARDGLETAERMTDVRQRLAALRNEWERSFGTIEAEEAEEDEPTRAVRRDLGRLRRGLRTPEDAYCLPILRALDELGGSGMMRDVIDRVGILMKDTLNQFDQEPLSSDPDSPRWRNTAQWARYQMVQDGLLKADSKRGVWEVSEKGRQTLNSKRVE